MPEPIIEVSKMNAIRIIVCTLCTLFLGACGSIKSSQILGTPVNPPPVYTPGDLDVGERPSFSAIISKGSFDTIRDVWLDLRITPGQGLRVNWSDINCNQISSQRRYCSYTLQGAVQAGATVTGTWNARFRYGNPDTDSSTVSLPGTTPAHDLAWNFVFLLEVIGTELAAVAPTDGVFVLEADHDYTLSGTILNNAGPVLPMVAETRLEFADSSIADIVIPVVKASGMQAGETSGAAFPFTTPAITTSVDGTITASFANNFGDIDPTNDIYSMPIRVEP